MIREEIPATAEPTAQTSVVQRETQEDYPSKDEEESTFAASVKSNMVPKEKTVTTYRTLHNRTAKPRIPTTLNERPPPEIANLMGDPFRILSTPEEVRSHNKHREKDIEKDENHLKKSILEILITGLSEMYVIYYKGKSFFANFQI